MDALKCVGGAHCKARSSDESRRDKAIRWEVVDDGPLPDECKSAGPHHTWHIYIIRLPIWLYL